MASRARTSSRRWLGALVRGAQFIVPLLIVIALWRHIAPILLLLVIALLLSSVLAPLVALLESRLRLSRLLGVLTVYAVMLTLIFGLAKMVGGVVVRQADEMMEQFRGKELESLITNLKVSVVGFLPEAVRPTVEVRLAEMVEHPPAFLTDLAGDLAGFIGKLISMGMNLILVLVFTFILLLEARNFKVQFLRAMPNAYFEMTLNLLDKINDQVSGYLRGQAIAAASVGVLSTLGLFIIQLAMGVVIPYFVIIGMLAGFANLIPFIGPFVGMIPAIVVYLMTDQVEGIDGLVPVVIVAMFILVQMIDNFFVSPKIMSASVGIHPLVVMVVILIGGSIMGPLGMLFAVPTYGVVKATTTELVWGLKAYRIL